MNSKEKAIIIWGDENIVQSKHCQALKRAFVKIFVQERNRTTFQDDRISETYVENNFSKTSYSYKTSIIELYAFTTVEECTQCIEDNKESRVFFVVSPSLSNRIAREIIEKYPETLQISSDYRSGSVYVFGDDSLIIDQLWLKRYFDDMAIVSSEIDLLKKLINDIVHYFITLGQKQYEFGTPQSIHQSLAYYNWAKALLERVFGTVDPWQCKEIICDIDKQIAQSQMVIHQSPTDMADIDQLILPNNVPDERKLENLNGWEPITFDATLHPVPTERMVVEENYPAAEASENISTVHSNEKSEAQTQGLGEGKQCSSKIPVYLQVPAIQTEDYKNLLSILTYLFASNLILTSDVQNCLKLSEANDTILIVHSLFYDADKLVLKKIRSMGRSISLYLLGVEPNTVNDRHEFFTNYPQVRAVLNDPQQLANKLAVDVALKSRVMGDRYARSNNKECADLMYDQCISLLNRLNDLTKKMANRN